uniref:hypothetical protein n=1 Tax=Yoonia sp. TaxID=2212373 RepID=UPI0040479045
MRFLATNEAGRTALKFITKILLIGTITGLAACSGTMQGVMRGSGQPVQFSYEQGMDSDTLTAVIDGESFRGKSVMRGASTTVGTGFGTVRAAGTTAFGTTTVFGSTYTGDFVAVLLGSRGSSLSCQLQYADSSGFTTSGGVGVCQHSDGRVMDIIW